MSEHRYGVNFTFFFYRHRFDIAYGIKREP